MKRQIKKLINKYESKVLKIEKIIDSREKAGLDCYRQYKQLTDEQAEIENLTYLLTFTDKERKEGAIVPKFMSTIAGCE